MSEKLSPGLYIVATPIGNLGDITRRAIDVLTRADAVACEDTRVTGKLLHLLGIKRPLVRHDDHSDARAVAVLVERCRTEAIALTSDAGTPLISDPGYELVRACRAADVTVTTLPGPSAAIAALTLSGLPTDRFLFAGFLPSKTVARADMLRELSGIRATLVFYESGPRLAASLAAMRLMLGDREACVARELTKLHEDVRTGRLSALGEGYATAPKGELVVMVGPPEDEDSAVDQVTLDELIRAELEQYPPAQAARELARRMRLDRREIYERMLELKGGA